MSIPNLCHACHKYHHATVVNACPFCRDVQFPEAILCDLARDHERDETDPSPPEDVSEETGSMSPQDQWFRAYAVQQLGIDPDLIYANIQYHAVLSTRQRVNVFASEHREPMADLVRQAALPFAQTTVHVVWLASDHLHLYIDASPEYALDEIVQAITDNLEHAMTNLRSPLPHSNQPVWERAYFVEGIG